MQALNSGYKGLTFLVSLNVDRRTCWRTLCRIVHRADLTSVTVLTIQVKTRPLWRVCSF